ncbi:hypothetical protein HKBW3S09_01682 [Candidatus Hakubella thermalkaliphila]|uniref:RRM domain-containing protein n=1 Tax=Candidatus Hakubella thermalkaliphila TaxID=2754717 RepID=A0A6V8NVE5_9ACTN|nr:hypothetical protein HKBW3S09_01682 [Candidatus Hakubella thermalkaliphila]GFP43778.1 hypothetical protein HKBW3C_02908 [Candidatus Hakubella thermalkaliphila]
MWGGFPYSVKEEKLLELFSQHGSVQSVKLISDKYTGRSKGFGFIEMGSAEEAQKAISELNGIEFEGRTLVVSEARPQEDRPRRSEGGRSEGGRGPRKARW